MLLLLVLISYQRYCNKNDRNNNNNYKLTEHCVFTSTVCMDNYGAWWLIGRIGALCPQDRRFECWITSGASRIPVCVTSPSFARQWLVLKEIIIFSFLIYNLTYHRMFTSTV